MAARPPSRRAGRQQRRERASAHAESLAVAELERGGPRAPVAAGDQLTGGDDRAAGPGVRAASGRKRRGQRPCGRQLAPGIRPARAGLWPGLQRPAADRRRAARPRTGRSARRAALSRRRHAGRRRGNAAAGLSLGRGGGHAGVSQLSPGGARHDRTGEPSASRSAAAARAQHGHACARRWLHRWRGRLLARTLRASCRCSLRL